MGLPKMISSKPTMRHDDMRLKDLTDPLGATGVTTSQTDPVGIPPPQGAIRLSSILLPDPMLDRYINQQASYEYHDQIQSAVDHYLKGTADGGWKLLPPRPQGNGQMMVFGKGYSKLIVVLRKNPRDANIVLISVTATIPAE